MKRTTSIRSSGRNRGIPACPDSPSFTGGFNGNTIG